MTIPIQRARSKSSPLPLENEENVEGGPLRYRALTAQPWLRLVGAERWRSRWISLSYSTGLFEDPVRPIIRFRIADGSAVQFVMNGAVTGSAQWTGRVPDGTQAVSI